MESAEAPPVWLLTTPERNNAVFEHAYGRSSNDYVEKRNSSRTDETRFGLRGSICTGSLFRFFSPHKKSSHPPSRLLILNARQPTVAEMSTSESTQNISTLLAVGLHQQAFFSKMWKTLAVHHCLAATLVPLFPTVVPACKPRDSS